MDKLQKFLGECGLKDPESIDTKDPELMKKVAGDLQSQLATGFRANSILKKIQNYNPQADFKEMGLPAPETADTIAEFKSQRRSFCIAKSMCRGEIQNPFMKINVDEGTDYVMTGGLYDQCNQFRVIFKPSGRDFNEEYTPYNGENLDKKTLLIWRTGGIGDLIFIRPIICHLKDKYPTCKIMFATKASYHPMVEQWPEIDELSPIPFTADMMDRANYHLTFEGLIERCGQAETMDVHDLFARYAGLNPQEIEWCRPMQAATKNQWLYDSKPEKYVVVQPRSSSHIRTPRIGSIVEAINTVTALGYKAILVDSPYGARGCDDIISCCEDRSMVVNFTRHSESIVDSIKLINGAAMVIAPDSSMIHIAAMQGVPALGLYGPFPGRVRLQRYPKCDWIEPKPSEICPDGGCSCFCHAHLRCDYNERCWDNLDNSELSKKIRKILKEK